MPQVDNIDKFTRTLSDLGDEPAILRERGEEMELPTPQDSSTDLSDLFSDSSDIDSPEPAADDGAPDLSDFGFDPLGEENGLDGDDFAGFEDLESPDDFGADSAADEADDLGILGELDNMSDDLQSTIDSSINDDFSEPEETAVPNADELFGDSFDQDDSSLSDPELDAGLETGFGSDLDSGFDVDTTEAAGDLDTGGFGDLENELDSFLGDLAQNGAELEGELGSELDGELSVDEDLGNFADSGEDDFSFTTDADSESVDFTSDLGDDLSGDLGDLGDDISLDEADVNDGELADFSSFSLDDDIPDAEVLDDGMESLDDDISDFGAGDNLFADDTDNSVFSEPDEPAAEADEFDLGDDFDLGDSFDEDAEADDFSLGDLGAEFGILEDTEEISFDEEDLNSITESEAAEISSAAEADEEDAFEISDDEFKTLKNNLGHLPLNVKIAVEEIIGESKGSFEDRVKLLHRLIDGDTVKSVAALAGRIIGKRLAVPKGAERRTAAEFQEEQKSFGYIFRHKFLPLIAVSAAGLLILTFLGALGYNFVYKPIRANGLYEKGLEEIEAARFLSGDQYFDEAYMEWPDDNRFIQYAEKYVDSRAFTYADEKYVELFSQYIRDNKPSGTEDNPIRNYYLIKKFDELYKKALLSYGQYNTEIRKRYDLAEREYFTYLMETNYGDYDVILARGDNYLAWGDINPDFYMKAKEQYNIAAKFGMNETLIYRQLLTAVRSESSVDADVWYQNAEANDHVAVDPYTYSVYAGFLYEEGRYGEMYPILQEAEKVAVRDTIRVPELGYNYARYYNYFNQPRMEERTLKEALVQLNQVKPWDHRRYALAVDLYRRQGELLYKNGNVLDAGNAFASGVEIYEAARREEILQPEPMFGKLYADLGDIAYFNSLEYENALELYQRAIDEEYDRPENAFKMGYIFYRTGASSEALSRFIRTEEAFGLEQNVLFSLGNTFYKRQSYESSIAYYNMLIDRLRDKRNSIRNFIPLEDSTHRALNNMMIMTTNNLGVSQFEYSQLTNDRDMYALGLSNVTQSVELFDNLGRDSYGKELSDARSLAFQNMRYITTDGAGGKPLIFGKLPKTHNEDVVNLLY